jgi:hypothetical protein
VASQALIALGSDFKRNPRDIKYLLASHALITAKHFALSCH